MFVSGSGEAIRRQALSSKRLASFFATAAPLWGTSQEKYSHTVCIDPETGLKCAG